MYAIRSYYALGQIDLLTVAAHEIGHVLGFDHDAQVAVMNGVVSPGQRVLLSEEIHLDNLLVADSPISAFSISTPDLNLSDGANDGLTISISVNSDGTLDISGSAIDDGTSIAGINVITSYSIHYTKLYE